MSGTSDFIKSDFPATLYPLNTNLIVSQYFEGELSKYIHEKILAEDGGAHNFLPQQRVYATKPRGHLRRTVKLDPIAEYYLYDVVYRNKSIFRKQVSEERASFGYRFEGGAQISINLAFREFRKLILAKMGEYKHYVRFDIASYFNSIYHHDLSHWFSSKAVSKKDSDSFSRFMREINAGKSIDFLPHGVYPSKMIGNEFLKFVEISGQVKCAQTARFMDDFYLFDNSEAVVARDFCKIQQLLGQFALNVNPSKTAYDEATSDVASTITEIKKSLMEVVEIEQYIDTPSGVDVVSEEVEVEKNLDKSQVELLLGFLKEDSLDESDADLILSILRSHSDSVLEYFPVLLLRFPNIYKHIYVVAAQTTDREALAAIVLTFLNQSENLLEYQLFWLAAIAEETLSETPQFGSILNKILELSAEFNIAKAKVLEIPVQDFGLKEIRSDHLKTGSSDWLSWASAAGSRTLNEAERNYALAYFSKGSPLNNLVAGAVMNWIPAPAPAPVPKTKGIASLFEKLSKASSVT